MHATHLVVNIFLIKRKLKLVHVNTVIFVCFSLHPIKAITTGEGGIITPRNKNIGKKIRQFEISWLN